MMIQSITSSSAAVTSNRLLPPLEHGKPRFSRRQAREAHSHLVHGRTIAAWPRGECRDAIPSSGLEVANNLPGARKLLEAGGVLFNLGIVLDDRAVAVQVRGREGMDAWLEQTLLS